MYNYTKIINKHGVNSMKYIKTIKLPGFTLYDTNLGYPTAIRSFGDNIIVVDLFELDDHAFESIEYMEVNAGYEEDFVSIDDQTYSIFLFSSNQIEENFKLITSGDWIMYVNKSIFIKQLNN